MNAGMIEKALCDFFRKDESGFKVEESSRILQVTRPSVAWQVSGGVFETDENGVRLEKLRAVCLAADRNDASEAKRRQYAHDLTGKVISLLSGTALELENGEATAPFQIESWQDVTGELDFSAKLVVVQAEFSVSMPAQSPASDCAETGSDSLKECVRLAVKAIVEEPPFGFIALPTSANFGAVKGKALAKVAWEGPSQALERPVHGLSRREGAIAITIAAPCTIENWQDETSLLEQKFNHSKINQETVIRHLPEKFSKYVGGVEIAEMSVSRPGLPGAHALAKISINIQYSIPSEV